MNKPEVLTEQDKLNASLPFKWPYREVKGLIDEICLWQRDDTFKKTVRAVFERGKEECPHIVDDKTLGALWRKVTTNRSGCHLCWAELLKEVEG